MKLLVFGASGGDLTKAASNSHQTHPSPATSRSGIRSRAFDRTAQHGKAAGDFFVHELTGCFMANSPKKIDVLAAPSVGVSAAASAAPVRTGCNDAWVYRLVSET